MVVIILGFSKSGTTMCARALHKAGINFGIKHDADYPKQPYEEKEGCDLIMEQIHAPKKDSLFIPFHYTYNDQKIKEYIAKRKKDSKNWGFKFPYMTYVYGHWKSFLPEHIVFALKRSPESLLTHYTKNRKEYDKKKAERIWFVQNNYNKIIDLLGVKVFHFEKILSEGFGELEDYLGLLLPDVRDYKGIGDGNKYFRRKK